MAAGVTMTELARARGRPPTKDSRSHADSSTTLNEHEDA